MNINNGIPLESLEMTNKIIVIVGSSGSGKTTLANRLVRNLNIKQLVTTTTRPIRKRENHGKDYYFVSGIKFDEMVRNHEFLETTTYSGHHYGLTFAEVDKHKADLCCVITDINGARSIADYYPDRTMIVWIKSTPWLLYNRLKWRGERFPTIVKRLINAFKKHEFFSPIKDFKDVSFTELDGSDSIGNNFGIIYYKLLSAEYSHNSTYLQKLESETNGGELRNEKTLL